MIGMAGVREDLVDPLFELIDIATSSSIKNTDKAEHLRQALDSFGLDKSGYSSLASSYNEIYGAIVDGLSPHYEAAQNLYKLPNGLIVNRDGMIVDESLQHIAKEAYLSLREVASPVDKMIQMAPSSSDGSDTLSVANMVLREIQKKSALLAGTAGMTVAAGTAEGRTLDSITEDDSALDKVINFASEIQDSVVGWIKENPDQLKSDLGYTIDYGLVSALNIPDFWNFLTMIAGGTHGALTGTIFNSTPAPLQKPFFQAAGTGILEGAGHALNEYGIEKGTGEDIMKNAPKPKGHMGVPGIIMMALEYYYGQKGYGRAPTLSEDLWSMLSDPFVLMEIAKLGNKGVNRFMDRATVEHARGGCLPKRKKK